MHTFYQTDPAEHRISNKVSVCSTLRPVQEKAEGEPKVKKGKTLLDDDEDNEEGEDESPEEVRGGRFQEYCE